MPRKPTEQAVHEFTQAIAHLVRRVRAAAATHDLSLTESAVITRLDKHGPATTAGLARAESIKPQSMGATIAALEARGIVARKPHPTDRRQFHIHLTPKGRAIRQTTREAKHTWIAQHIAQLTPHERQTLFAAGHILKRMVDKAGP
jgi:DNA-binding MarR family transcriptional regulator